MGLAIATVLGVNIWGSVCVCRDSGLQAEGLLHCHPGPSDAHGGGFLEDGVGMEVSLHCHAHWAPGEGAGKLWLTAALTTTAVQREPSVFRFPASFTKCYFYYQFVFVQFFISWTKSDGRIFTLPCVFASAHLLSAVAGQMLSILARRGLGHLRRLHSGAEGRHSVWHIQSARLGTHLCPGKQIHFSLSRSS